MVELRCTGLTKKFGDAIALDDFSLDFPKSGVVAIIGPNGAGKTTLLHCLSGFLEADQGCCTIDGVETTAGGVERVARLGVRRTFQLVRVFPELATWENAVLSMCGDWTEKVFATVFAKQTKESVCKKRQKAEKLLEQIGILEKANQLAHTLSYGQKKLLTLAMCAVSDAKLLLLDEPVSGVDYKTSEAVIALTRQIGESGRLVLMVEHDLAAVAKVADRIIVMANGKLLKTDTVSAILDDREIMERYFE
jgi:branched-chain amino acid transport system ATP-binding protein